MALLSLVNMSTGNKRKRTPCDAQWCLDNINDLSIKSFATNFSMSDRMYATTRYKNILTKYAPTDHKERLLQELAIWTKSMDVVDFWKEMKRKATLRTTDSICSQIINKLLTTDAQNLLEFIDTSTDQGLPTATPEQTPVCISAALEPDRLVEATSMQDLLPTPPLPSTNQDNTRGNEDSNEDSNNDSEWTFNGTNVTNLFRQYQHKIKTQVADKKYLPCPTFSSWHPISIATWKYKSLDAKLSILFAMLPSIDLWTTWRWISQRKRYLI